LPSFVFAAGDRRRAVAAHRHPADDLEPSQIAASVPEAVDRLYVIRYGKDHWDASRIEAEINQAADWATRNGVPLVCNEFGAFRYGVDPPDRAASSGENRTGLR